MCNILIFCSKTYIQYSFYRLHSASHIGRTTVVKYDRLGPLIKPKRAEGL